MRPDSPHSPHRLTALVCTYAPTHPLRVRRLSRGAQFRVNGSQSERLVFHYASGAILGARNTPLYTTAVQASQDRRCIGAYAPVG
jgi:hypothetical protein